MVTSNSSRLSSDIVVSNDFRVPKNDLIGRRILQDLILCLQRNRVLSNPVEDNPIVLMDIYAEHRINSFFSQPGYITQNIVRDMCYTVEQRYPGQYQYERQFLLDVCSRYDMGGCKLVVQKMDEDKDERGKLMFIDTWRLWNEFCRCLQLFRDCDSEHIYGFRGCNPISEGMIHQFYVNYIQGGNQEGTSN